MVKGEMESGESKQSQAEHFDGRPAEMQESKSIPVEPTNTEDAAPTARRRERERVP
jgi:hypothetical protein